MTKIKNSEIWRKVLHLFSSIIPLSYLFLIKDRQTIYILLFIILCISLLIEYKRNKVGSIFRIIFLKHLNLILRRSEIKGGLTGATWMILSFTLTVFLFDMHVAVPALLFLSIGDSVAALFGIKYPIGRIWNKSFSGTLMGTLSCIIIVLSINQTLSPIIIILGAISAMVIEILPLKINDNFSIPIFSGIMMHVLSKII